MTSGMYGLKRGACLVEDLVREVLEPLSGHDGVYAFPKHHLRIGSQRDRNADQQVLTQRTLFWAETITHAKYETRKGC